MYMCKLFVIGRSLKTVYCFLCVEVYYNLTRKRTEGSIYGTFNLTRRIGQTIGNSAAVLALGWIGYDTALADAGMAQAAGVITGIKILCVLVPGIFFMGSWFAFKYIWNITPEIRAEIAAKKSAAKTK